MRKIVFFALCLCTGQFLKAQSLSGHVIDSTTHTPVAGVSIYLPGTNLGAVTDKDGNFNIAHVPNGIHELKVGMIGYAPMEQRINIHGDATLNLTLVNTSISLHDIVITSLGNATVLRRAPVPVTVVTNNMFLQQASSNVSDALAKILAEHDQVDGLWYHGTAPGSRQVEASSVGNLKRTWVNGGRARDWWSTATGEGRAFLAAATQVKTIWLPFGD